MHSSNFSLLWQQAWKMTLMCIQIFQNPNFLPRLGSTSWDASIHVKISSFGSQLLLQAQFSISSVFCAVSNENVTTINMVMQWDMKSQFSILLTMQIYYDVCKHKKHAKQSNKTQIWIKIKLWKTKTNEFSQELIWGF